jgi:hypothetical protein
MNSITVKADVGSLLANVTRFFLKEDAYIQELLQNARRAEAGEVVVSLTENHISIKDNGSGVEDPEKLVTIGGSKWRPDTHKEMPAGMGLFSGFNVAKTITIRSRNWRVVMDYAAMSKTGRASLEYLKESISGTEIRLDLKNPAARFNHHTWEQQAAYMPFKTVIHYMSMDDEGKKTPEKTEVQTFNPNNVPGYDASVRLSCGTLYIKENGAHRPGHLVTQGVAIPLAETHSDWAPSYGYGYKQHSFLLCVDIGTVDLRLPDRSAVLNNKKLKKLNEEGALAFRNYCIEQVTKGTDNDHRESYARFVALHHYDDLPLLPKAYQLIPLNGDYGNGFRRPDEIRALSKEGRLVGYEVGNVLLESVLGGASLYKLDDTKDKVGVLEAVMGVLPRYITESKIRIKRHDSNIEGPYLWRIENVKLTWSDGVIEYRPASNNAAVLVELHCALDDGEVAFADAKDKEYWEESQGHMDSPEFVLLHTTPEGKDLPEIDFQFWNDYDFGGPDADSVWDDATLRLATLDCAPGLFINQAQIGDINASIRSKFKIPCPNDASSRIRPTVDFENLNMEIDGVATMKSGTLVMSYELGGETLGERRIVFKANKENIIEKVADTGYLKVSR